MVARNKKTREPLETMNIELPLSVQPETLTVAHANVKPGKNSKMAFIMKIWK